MSRAPLCALVCGVALVAACDEDLLNPMAARQPVVGNPVLSTGRLGVTIPPGAPAFPGLTPAPLISYATSFPMKVDRPLIELGKKRFDIICATCHGPVGDGDSIVARQMSLRP